MTDKLNDDVKRAIAENMPESVGSILRQRLEKAEKDAVQVDYWKNLYNQQYKKTTDLEDALARHRAMDEREKAVHKREVDLATKEVAVETQGAVLSALATERNARVGDLKEVVLAVFQNKYRYSETINKQVPVPGQPGSYPTTVATSEHKQVEGSQG